MEDKVFIDGYITRDIPDTMPLFILGAGAIHADKMIKWLQENKKYADKGGWIPYQTLRSKEKGTRYSVIDMYQVNKSIDGAKTTMEDAQPKYRTQELSQKQQSEVEVGDKLFNNGLSDEDLEAMEHMEI